MKGFGRELIVVFKPEEIDVFERAGAEGLVLIFSQNSKELNEAIALDSVQLVSADRLSVALRVNPSLMAHADIKLHLHQMSVVYAGQFEYSADGKHIAYIEGEPHFAQTGSLGVYVDSQQVGRVLNPKWTLQWNDRYQSFEIHDPEGNRFALRPAIQKMHERNGRGYGDTNEP